MTASELTGRRPPLDAACATAKLKDLARSCRPARNAVPLGTTPPREGSAATTSSRRGEAAARVRHLPLDRFFVGDLQHGPPHRRGSARSARRSEIRQAGHAAAPRLSGIGSSLTDIIATLDHYKVEGIRHVVALRGDLPSGTANSGAPRTRTSWSRFIRRRTPATGSRGGRLFPEFLPRRAARARISRTSRRKVEAGADAAITQYFYDADCYFRLRGRVRAPGIDLPDRPGHHADRQLQPARALLGRLRGRDPALDPPPAREASATTPPRSAASGSTSSPTSATVCSRRGAPGLHFYTTEPGRPHHHHLAAARALGHPA